MFGKHFEAAAWLRTADPAGVRHEYGRLRENRPRLLLEDGHTKPSDTDRAFMVASPTLHRDLFQMFCHHAGCQMLAADPTTGKPMPGVFLDALCQQLGVKDAAELVEWCGPGARERWEASEAKPGGDSDSGPTGGEHTANAGSVSRFIGWPDADDKGKPYPNRALTLQHS